MKMVADPAKYLGRAMSAAEADSGYTPVLRTNGEHAPMVNMKFQKDGALRRSLLDKVRRARADPRGMARGPFYPARLGEGPLDRAGRQELGRPAGARRLPGRIDAGRLPLLERLCALTPPARGALQRAQFSKRDPQNSSPA